MVRTRRATAAVWAVLMALAVLAPAAAAAEPPAPELIPPGGQTAVKTGDVVGFGGSVDPGATLLQGFVVYRDAGGTRAGERDVLNDPDYNNARRLRADDQGNLSGSWVVPTDQFVPAGAKTVELEVTVRQPDGASVTGSSPRIDLDMVRPYIASARLTAPRTIVVVFNEPVFYPRAFEEPTAWVVDGSRNVLRVEGSGDRRTLTISAEKDQDATPLVQFRPLEGTLSPVYYDGAGNTLDPAVGKRSATALDRILPAVPDITVVDGDDADSGPTLGNTTSPVVRVAHDRAGHRIVVYLETDGQPGLTTDDERVGNGQVTDEDDGTYAEFAVTGMREGDNQLYAVAFDPADNASDGADEAIYDLDTTAPLPVSAVSDSSSVFVTFSEDIFGDDDPADWKIVSSGTAPSVTQVSGDGDRRQLTLSGPVPSGSEVRYQPPGGRYTDAHGNVLADFALAIAPSPLPVIDVVGDEVQEDVGTLFGQLGGTLTFTVTLSRAPGVGEQITVGYRTVQETATEGTDYGAESGQITFSSGQDEAQVDVDVAVDELDEFDETLRLELQDPNGAAFPGGLSQISATGTILDDDDPVTAALEGGHDDEGQDARVTVVLDGPSGKSVQVAWRADSGSADVNDDLLASSGSITVPAGQLSAVIRIPTVADAFDEAHESFTVAATKIVNADSDGSEAYVTIVDDDRPPAIRILDAYVDEGDSGTVAVRVQVGLTAPSGRTVSFDYHTEDRDAVAGQDYRSAQGSLTIPAGALMQTFEVQVIGDRTAEDIEEFATVLTGVTDAVIWRSPGIVGIFDDDGAGTASTAGHDGGAMTTAAGPAAGSDGTTAADDGGGASVAGPGDTHDAGVTAASSSNATAAPAPPATDRDGDAGSGVAGLHTSPLRAPAGPRGTGLLVLLVGLGALMAGFRRRR